MTFFSILISSIIGCLSGLLYGLSFLVSRGRVFTSHAPQSSGEIIRAVTASALTRMLLFAVLLLYLLHWPTINFILLIMAFFVTFWFTVLTRKACSHERI